MPATDTQWEPPRGEEDLLIKSNNCGYAVTESPPPQEVPPDLPTPPTP